MMFKDIVNNIIENLKKDSSVKKIEIWEGETVKQCTQLIVTLNNDLSYVMELKPYPLLEETFKFVQEWNLHVDVVGIKQLTDGIMITQPICMKCNKPIQGDSQYHQVFDSTDSKLIGVRHRRCS